MKNTWKGIKSIISLQKATNDSQKTVSLGDETVADPRVIANTSNSFFCLVAAEVQPDVPFSRKTFLNIYHHLNKTRFSSYFV